MKKTILLPLCLMVFVSSLIYAQGDPDFGFTGVVQEYVIKQLNPKVTPNITDEANIADLDVLMVGFSSIQPSDVDFECFKFVTYYWAGSSLKSYVGMIVANTSNKNRSGVDVSIEVKGPRSSKIQVKRTIPMNTAMLYVFEFQGRFSGTTTGVYDIIGTVNHNLAWCSQAITRVVVDDIW